MAMVLSEAIADEAAVRPRARDAGIIIGTLTPGKLNAITDVPGVRVGQTTRAEGTHIHTGVTAIFPHDGNVFEHRVPAAVVVGNGFGKLLGMTQIQELGELETPILLTGTLGVWKAADFMTDWLLQQPGMQNVRSINPVVGETNDGFLNDIRAKPLRREDVVQALKSAHAGMVEEGSVGAGAGTVAFGWKGGIGTSSRVLSQPVGGYVVGVLVQTNFGGHLTVAGVPVWRELPDPQEVTKAKETGKARSLPESAHDGDGSIMIIVATDAPLDSRLLRRLAARALVGLARTGSVMSNGSGDYVIAFSNSKQTRIDASKATHHTMQVGNDAMTPLFEAAADATEEAIIDSLFQATTVVGHRGTAAALPLELVLKQLHREP